MRHWLWYKTTGEICGDEVMYGGWDPALDFNDPACPEEAVQNIRALRLPEPDFGGFAPFDCACAAEVGICNHPAEQCAYYTVDTQTLEFVVKPLYVLKLDGVEVDPWTSTDKAPVSAVALVLEGAVPDGVVMQVFNDPNGPHLLQSSPAEVTFSSGVTPAVNLTAPVHGVSGRIAIRPVSAKDTVSRGLTVRGWQA